MFHYLERPSVAISAKPKALLMLHGFGSNEADLFSFVHQIPQDIYVFSARAPFSLDFGGYAWYDIFLDANNNKISDNQQAMESLLQLSQFIDYLIDKHHLDTDNFNLLGFSQGSILSYALALHYPEKIKNIVALSGYINQDIMPVQEKTAAYRHLHFFISHGTFDDIIPIEAARKIPPFLLERNIRNDYHEYPMGHEVNMQCLQDMLVWIEQNI